MSTLYKRYFAGHQRDIIDILQIRFVCSYNEWISKQTIKYGDFVRIRHLT